NLCTLPFRVRLDSRADDFLRAQPPRPCPPLFLHLPNRDRPRTGGFFQPTEQFRKRVSPMPPIHLLQKSAQTDRPGEKVRVLPAAGLPLRCPLDQLEETSRFPFFRLSRWFVHFGWPALVQNSQLAQPPH